MEELQVNEVLIRNRELQNEQNANLETLVCFAMDFHRWALSQIKQLQELACSQAKKIEKMGFEIDSKGVMVKELQRELENKIGVVKELQQLACSQRQKIEQVGFEINNKVVMVKEVQHELDNKNGEVKELQQQLENKIREVNRLQRELDNKNDEVKELEQADDLIVHRLRCAYQSGFVAGSSRSSDV